MKRTLALVLALVMAIGLMAFPVSADFTDDADIKYTEAVDVMSAIGVIDGFEDGSFDPDGYLTREQAAKVVAYLMLGADDADALTATSAPFDDVAANRWSAGYIAYCVNEGIINGRSDTTFDPTGNVTGYEFAKLMLGCLGYDGAIEKYTGAEWNINVAKTALTVGLFTGNKGANYNVPLTREEAALYAFNMIQADLVDYDNRGSEIDLGNGVTINTGASKAEPITTANESSSIKDEVGSKTEDNAVWTVQFAERYFEDLEKNTGDNDAFGRPSTEWTYDRDDIGTYSDTADFTYTTGTKGKDIYSDLNKPSASKTEYNYFVDGEEFDKGDIGSIYKADGEGFAIDSGVDVKIGGNGTLIEVYEVDPSDKDVYDEAYNVVVINTYAAEIIDWTEADEDEDVEESVTIGELTVPERHDFDSTTFETTKFDEDDADDSTVVLYTVALNDDDKYEIQSVDVAERVTATPTRVTVGTSFVAGGETYKYAAYYEGAVTSAIVKNDEDIDFYLDNYGYVVFVDTEGSASDDYAYVEAVEEAAGQFAKGYVAKMVLANGEVVIADLDEDYTESKSFSKEEFTNGALVTYTVNKDDEYTFETVINDKNTVGDELEISKGKATVAIDDNTDRTANSKTVFFVQDGDDYNVYTGIANVPTIKGVAADDDNSATHVFVDTGRGNILNAIFVSDSKVSSSLKDVVVVAYDKSAKPAYDSDAGDHYEYNVLVDGEQTTMKFDKGLAEKLFTADEDAIYVLSSISYDKDEVVVTSADIADEKNDDVYVMDKAGTVKTADDLVGFGYNIDDERNVTADVYLSYTDDCVVYKVDDCDFNSASVTSIRNDADDMVTYVTDDGVVTAIYILVK